MSDATTPQADERTLILIKPDAVSRNLIGEVLRRVETKGYKVVAARLMQADEALLARHYAEHADKYFYPGLVAFMTSGPLMAVVAQGHQVIKGVRSLMGETDPTAAAPGTIRGDLGRDWGQGKSENLIHGSDSLESAAAEIALWFPDVAFGQ